MATLEFIALVPRHPEVIEKSLVWVRAAGNVVQRLPQIVWRDHSTWSEANLWAFERSADVDPETIRSSMTHLLGYANWLEDESVDWWHFPAKKRDRCLTRFRGFLIRSRDAGEIAPSTATQRMSAVVRFYRWLHAHGHLTTVWPMWSERRVGIRLTDAFGFEHTMSVSSTDLAIRNNKVAGALQLEDGVMPLTSTAMREVLEFAETHASEELTLMLKIGACTGLRLGSILDLKLATLERASIDPLAGWYRLEVGPSARPPVATKFGNSGLVPIPTFLLEELRDYASSTRRLMRQAKASPQHRDLLFLTRFGGPYSAPESRAINVEMVRLRRAAISRGATALRDFHFHRTRATFATVLMRQALKFLPVGDAVRLVREACLHKDEATTLKYVKFIETTQAMAEAADAFTNVFLGLAQGARNARG